MRSASVLNHMSKWVLTNGLSLTIDKNKKGNIRTNVTLIRVRLITVAVGKE
jgi:hypothetical protein